MRNPKAEVPRLHVRGETHVLDTGTSGGGIELWPQGRRAPLWPRRADYIHGGRPVMLLARPTTPLLGKK
jgi:hypothetical protein